MLVGQWLHIVRILEGVLFVLLYMYKYCAVYCSTIKYKYFFHCVVDIIINRYSSANFDNMLFKSIKLGFCSVLFLCVSKKPSLVQCCLEKKALTRRSFDTEWESVSSTYSSITCFTNFFVRIFPESYRAWWIIYLLDKIWIWNDLFTIIHCLLKISI